MDNIPIFDIVFDEVNAGVNTVSLVSSPAMESAWLAFNHSTAQYKLQSEEKRLILGALLIPDKLVLRRDDSGNPFFIRFSKDVIEKTVYKYFKTSKTNNTNAEHDQEWTLDGVYMVSSFIKDSSMGINPPVELQDHPDGTWFGMFRVEDDEVWEIYIKEGVFTGFSIEGIYSLADTGESASLAMSKEDKELEELADMILSKLDTLVD